MNEFPLRLAAARLRLVKDRPYLAAAAWSLGGPVETPGLSTLAVDKHWRLYYDPAVLERWTSEELAGVLYHEICHLLRSHAARLGAFDPRTANIAGDAEINDDLCAEGITLPGSPVTPESLGLPAHRLAEEYAAVLSRRRDGDGQRSGRDRMGGGAGEAPPGDTGEPGSPVSSDPSPAPSQAPDRPAASGGGAAGAKPGADRGQTSGRRSCGSCSHGRHEEWELGEDTPGGLRPTEAELIRRQVAEAIRVQAAGRDRGSIPAHWRRWAEEKLSPPQIDWRRELATAIRTAVAAVRGAVDYSYRRPSRRQVDKVILPSLVQPTPEVAIVVDTSGSVSDQDLSRALVEVGGVLRAVGQRGVTVLTVDAAVQTCCRVFRPEQVELRGGGGTDMAAGIAAAAARRPRPDVIIVITDGLTPWPERPPSGIRIIVALLGGGTAPAWARVVRVGEAG